MREFDFVLREFGSGSFEGSFDPNIATILKAVFDDAWSTLKRDPESPIRRTELALCIIRLATEGERDPGRLSGDALSQLNRAITWRNAKQKSVTN
jgi:hypothetical protein